MILMNDQLLARDEIVIDIEDRGYQFGDGVYEVVRFYDGKCFKMAEHLERLERSLREIHVELPYPMVDIEANLTKLMEASNVATGNIYIQITRGVAPRIHHFPEGAKATVVAYVMEFGRPVQNMENGIRATLLRDIRWERCDIKSLNLLGNVLAKDKAKKLGCEEAIMYRDTFVSEGSSTNVFIVQDGVLWTHPANNFILNGITRLAVIELAEKLGIPVREEAFSKEALLAADEVFITSTTAEVTPVVQVDEHVYGDGKPGDVTKQLRDAFGKLLFV